MSCTWTIFEGEKSLKGAAQKEEDDSQGVRSHGLRTARAKREEMRNLTIDKVKDERANTERERETEMRQNNLWKWGNESPPSPQCFHLQDLRNSLLTSAPSFSLAVATTSKFTYLSPSTFCRAASCSLGFVLERLVRLRRRWSARRV